MASCRIDRPAPKHFASMAHNSTAQLRVDDERALRRAFEGLRTVFCFSVIAFHCLMYWARLHPLAVTQQVVQRGWGELLKNSMAAMSHGHAAKPFPGPASQIIQSSTFAKITWHGMLGSDVFLVLSGYLAARQLLDSLCHPDVRSRSAIASYYRCACASRKA